MKEINSTTAWRRLEEHFEQHKNIDMRDLFASEVDRFERFSICASELFLDYSKNRITQETLNLLLALAKEANLAEKITAMFRGDRINSSEHKPALHVALRNFSDKAICVDGKDVMPLIQEVLRQMRDFTEQVASGNYLGITGKPISDVVSIGIGGSHLGPKLVTTALEYYSTKRLRYHFVSNIDSTEIVTTLDKLNPETTLFIISSKSFTTLETITNANAAKHWLCQHCGYQAVARHFVAATVNVAKAREFGITRERIFEFWPWVGGRFSVWSSIGLIVALAVGINDFEQLLMGAHSMDQHFKTAPFESNMPVILALLSIWYHNFFQMPSQAIVCYDHYLRYLPSYVQQVDMESNGKSVYQDGSPVQVATGPVIWGDCGTNSQHSFHQLLHQGTQLVPVDFIVALNSLNAYDQHQEWLIANCLAQSRALLCGRTEKQAYQQLCTSGYSTKQAALLAKHKAMTGNRPSNTIIIKKLTPHKLGALMALYELKVFVQGAILGINSFDQWGVELGKELAKGILPDLMAGNDDGNYDSSTQGLIKLYSQHK